MYFVYETAGNFIDRLDEIKPNSDQIRGEWNPFHHILTYTDENYYLKICLLCAKAEELNININERISINGKVNTPLMSGLLNEQFHNVLTFLISVKSCKLNLDLNFRDEEGKTALMLAVLLGKTPLEIIKELITPENYNIPTKEGLTPLAAACALRRVDIVEALINFGLQIENPNNCSGDEKAKLSKYLSQRHPKSKKTIVHFAVMRSGTVQDQSNGLKHQETVLNLLKLAGVDGLRDYNATHNAIKINFSTPFPLIKCPKTVLTYVCHINDKDFSGKAYLNSKSNQELLDLSIINSRGYLYFIQGFEDLAGVSLLAEIMSRTEKLITYLRNLGCDFSLVTNNGKTAEVYIQTLASHKAKQTSLATSVSIEDEEFLFPIAKMVSSLANNLSRFFYNNQKVVNLVMEYSAENGCSPG